MVSVVLMAGYRAPSEEHKRILINDYGEHPLPDIYKPLKEFKTRIDSKTFGYKPLIQFTMEKLERVNSVSDIVVVGDKKKLESRLGEFMKTSKKEYRVVDQVGSIDDAVLEEFGIGKINFESGSIAANGLKGYISSDAYKSKDYALFIASDSPGTSARAIYDFINVARLYTPSSSLVFPLVSMKELPKWRHAFHRKYLFLVNDSDYKFKDSFKTLLSNREGFRASSMLYADPSRLDLDFINMCYSLRKMLSGNVRKKIKHASEKLGVNRIWKKYFMSKDLSIKDCENSSSSILCKNDSRMIIIPIRDTGSSLDFDGTLEDEKMISDFLNSSESWDGADENIPVAIWTPNPKLA